MQNLKKIKYKLNFTSILTLTRSRMDSTGSPRALVPLVSRSLGADWSSSRDTSFFNINLIILFSFLLVNFYASSKSKTNLTIMLNPDGDAKIAGRVLNDSFERGITLQFCTKLKKELEKKCENIRVVLTRFPGETIEQLQNANFSNRLNADFYLSIHFYKETEVLPNLYIYYFLKEAFYSNNPISLHFYTFDNAHLLNIQKTIEYAKKLKNELKENTKFKTNNELGIPFKPLIGIVAPSLAIEAGIKESDSLDVYLEPISNAICKMLNNE